MKYVYIETYGCSANQNNSEIVAGLLRSAGYQITNNIDIAEIIFINSCIVKGKTENKIKRRVQDLSKDYGDEKLVIVGGCMPETDAKALKMLNDNVLLLGVKHYREIVKLVRDYYSGGWDWEKQDEYLSERKEGEEKVGVVKIASNKLISITQISEGCLGDCSYCKTRLAKGELNSYDMDKIVKSVENDLKNVG
jgi:tRNA A37 methylthiotransferase MiaB